MSSRSILPIVNGLTGTLHVRKPYGLMSNGTAWTNWDTPNLTQQWAHTANMIIKGFEGLWPLDLPRILGIIGNNGKICWYQPAVDPNQVLWSAVKDPLCENLMLSNCTLVSTKWELVDTNVSIWGQWCVWQAFSEGLHRFLVGGRPKRVVRGIRF